MSTAHTWTPSPAAFVTPDEYLDFEADAERHGGIRSEYINGRIRPMTEMGIPHIRIHSNLVGLLIVALRGRPFKAIGPEIPLRISADGSYYYPDVLVAPSLESQRDRGDSSLDPVSVFEITFPSTDSTDRGEKLRNYASREALRDYVIVAHDRVQVEHFARDGDSDWQRAALSNPTARLTLTGVDAAMSLADVYGGLEFPPAKNVDDSETREKSPRANRL